LLLEANRILKDEPGRQGREAAATRERLASVYESLGQPDKAARFTRTIR
jgi:hypothetical protein